MKADAGDKYQNIATDFLLSISFQTVVILFSFHSNL